MVEDAIKKAKNYPSRTKLWRSLPKKMQYQTLQLILRYLEQSNKIFITKEGKIMWILADSAKARKLAKESVPYARTKARR
ncbi:hypothetical protein DRN67_02020 [Candidatus Micrarchaeota archaeon]|nr:MAG: hypothetical protein DRN67_02020 [Candidatus Micrarchaeota archaeon]